jgi:hypothetical protein
MNQAEVVDRLDAVEAVLGKVSGETTALIDEVAALKAAMGQVSPEVEAALARVEARAKGVDDLVADPVAPAEPV